MSNPADIEKFIECSSDPAQREKCMILLEKDPSLVHASSDMGVPLIYYAVRGDCTAAAQYMIEQGAPLDFVEEHGWGGRSLLTIAVINKNESLVRRLLYAPSPPPINSMENNGLTALSFALWENTLAGSGAKILANPVHTKIALALIDRGADVNLSSPLHYWLDHNSIVIPQTVINAMAAHGLNTEDRVNGATTLQHALVKWNSSDYQHYEHWSKLVEHLLEIGADAHAAVDESMPQNLRDLQRRWPPYLDRHVIPGVRELLGDLVVGGSKSIERAFFDRHGRARPELLRAAALDQLDMVFTPKLWEEIGHEGSFALANRARDALPSHLQHRVPLVSMEREAPLARPDDTALVGYLRVSAPEVKR